MNLGPTGARFHPSGRLGSKHRRGRGWEEEAEGDAQLPEDGLHEPADPQVFHIYTDVGVVNYSTLIA